MNSSLLCCSSSDRRKCLKRGILSFNFLTISVPFISFNISKSNIIFAGKMPRKGACAFCCDGEQTFLFPGKGVLACFACV